MYALVEINGKQYKAIEGEFLKIDKISPIEKDKLEFNSVLFINKDGEIKIGKPYVANSLIRCTYKEDKKIKRLFLTGIEEENQVSEKLDTDKPILIFWLMK